LRSLSGEIVLINWDAEGIAITGDTAKVPVEFMILGERNFSMAYYSKSK
jgi:hypothetical protein